MSNKLPVGWKEISVGKILDVLPADVQKQVEETILSFDGNYFEITTKLKEQLKPHAEALLKVGVLPDYLAYAVVYSILPAMQSTKEAARVKKNGH